MTDYIGIILLCVLCVAALIGLIVGLCKGFMAISSWANEFVIAAVGATLIGVYAGDYLEDNAWLGPVVVIGAGIVIMLLFMLISASFRKGFARGITKHKRKLKYKNMEAVQESDADIVDALSRNDFKAYKKISKSQKKKLKQHRGGWGVCDRIFGAITGAIKYFTVLALIVVGCLMVLDMTGISVNGAAITDQYLYSIFESETWIFVQPYLMDFVLIGVICACIRRGYKSGLFSGLWTLLAIVLVIMGFYLAWVIVSESGSFDGWIEGLSNGMLSSLGDGDFVTTIAKVILTAFLGIIFAVVVILLAIFIPKAIDAARETKVFHFVDGILGAIVVTGIVVGVLLFLFGMVYTLNGVEPQPDFFVKMDSYFQGGVSKYFYSQNILNMNGWMPVDLSQFFG
ncbi:MAG: hypothetical protein LUD51_06350 [Clostridia bacterium]|nr:hypothetical protein [Clostridia bacterium]